MSPKTVRLVGSLRTFCTTASTVGCTARSVTPLPPDIEVLDGYGALDERVFEPVYPDHPGDRAEPLAGEVTGVVPDPLPPPLAELVLQDAHALDEQIVGVEG